MATIRRARQPQATFGFVGQGSLTVRGDGATVSLTSDAGLVLTLTVREAQVLARRLVEEGRGESGAG